MVDLLVKNGFVMTVDERHSQYRDGCVVVDDGLIIDVGESDRVCREYEAERVIDARDMAVLPGFVNAHVHTSEKLVPGLADDLDLYEWGQKVINPMMLNQSNEDCYWASLLGQVEMIKSGITCYADLFSSPNKDLLQVLVSTVEKSGMRAVIARENYNKEALPDEWRLSVPDEMTENMIEETTRYVKTQKGQPCRISVRFGLGGVCYAFPSLISRVRARATELGIGIHVHISESIDEIRFLKRQKNKTPVRYAYEQGLLGPDVLGAHCIWLDHEEIDILRRTGTKVAYNPVSNMKLADGVAPVNRMIEKGVTVGLGTDGAASNDNFDMFACMKMGSYLQKVHHLNPALLSSQRILEMATIDGARALQMEDRIGSIERGKKADLMLVSLNAPNIVPVHDLAKQLVCSGSPENVDTVIIDGDIVLEGRRFTKLDEARTIKESKVRAEKVVKRMYS